MIVACPSCKAKFRIDEGRIKPPGVRLRCARCQNLFAVRKRVVESAAPVGPPRESVDPAQGNAAEGRGRILVAHGEPVVAAAMRGALEKANYEVLISGDGVDALMKIQRERPGVAVIDVALPKMYGFEICEFLKRNESLRYVKVILVATEHNQGRYRRTPENYYGADDVVEESEIPGELAGKVHRLLHGGEDAGATVEPPGSAPGIDHEAAAGLVEPAAAEIAAQPEERPFAEPEDPLPEPERVTAEDDPRKEMRERARRLARIIVSDIALYNPEIVEQGLRSGGLPALIRDDLEEGYKLFRSRIDEAVAAESDFIREALDAFVDRKRRDLGIPDDAEAGTDPADDEHAVADDIPSAEFGTGHDDF
ncbi:MAG: zinc-ribbon domain-containing protein [Deltaproteobacteria bacterium]|nr:zinc-ribbon domain-containing protein [Deltaproteobacteria bacterium]